MSGKKPPYKSDEGNRVIVLERVNVFRIRPAYATGTTECVKCGHTVWVGQRTMQVVISSHALPFCHECMVEAAEADAAVGKIRYEGNMGEDT